MNRTSIAGAWIVAVASLVACGGPNHHHSQDGSDAGLPDATGTGGVPGSPESGPPPGSGGSPGMRDGGRPDARPPAKPDAGTTPDAAPPVTVTDASVTDASIADASKEAAAIADSGPDVGVAPDGGGFFEKLSCRQVIDINPGVAWGSPEQLTVVGDRIFFFATTVTYGKELWVTDGTAAGTHQVKEIRSGTMTGGSGAMAVLDGIVYFAGHDGVHGLELWRSDGTADGTSLVQDINSGTLSSSPYHLTVSGKYLYFDAMVQDAHALFRTDGTPAGTVKLVEPKPAKDSTFSEIVPFAGGVCFSADVVPGGRALWCTDGTVEGTRVPFKVPDSSNTTGDPRDVAVMGDALYFSAVSNGGEGLYRWDGVSAAPTLVKHLGPGAYNDRMRSLTAAGGRLFFNVFDGTMRAPWVSDGSAPGTHALDIAPSSDSWRFVAVGTRVAFAIDRGTGYEPWITDGTVSGTRLLKKLEPVERGSDPRFYESLDGSLYFAATDKVHGRELFRTDGTESGTELVADIAHGLPYSMPEFMVRFHGALYFGANDGRHGRELWKCARDGGPSDPDSFDPEAPCPGTAGPAMVRHGVYCIDSTEVTSGQYQQFLDTSPSPASQRADCVSKNTSFAPTCTVNGAQLPAACVDWCDAMAYCQWAGKHLCGRIGGLSVAAVLTSIDATMTQSYSACSDDGVRTSPYDATNQPAQCFGGGAATRPVGQQCEGSILGVFDLIGNVSEWQDEGRDGSTIAPTFGGGYLGEESQCTTSFTDFQQRTATFPFLGFRCCSE